MIVFVPAGKPARIRKGEGPIPLMCKVPIGPVRAIPLTPTRKKFLLKQGVDSELIKANRVWDVSETTASQFDKEREATEALAIKCGLAPSDLWKIVEARKKLGAYKPSSHLEQIAKRGLESLLYAKPRKKEAGRPSRISAAERQQMRERADELIGAGQKRGDVVMQFAEEYGLRLSYVRRILEDRRADVT